MKDLAERLWPAFRTEVAEQLDALELLLVQRAAASGDEVNAMFRHFHTIKGGCAMMGFVNMGALAHAAEDALDPVRRHERVLDETLVDALLNATDALKEHLLDAERTRSDGTPRDEIIARLRRTQGALARAAAGQSGRGAVGQPSGEGVPTPQFIEACQRRLGVLVAAAAQARPPAGFTGAIKELRLAAEASGLPAIAQLLAALAAAGPDSRRCTLLISEIVERIAELEQAHALDAGTQRAVGEVRELLHQKLLTAAAALAASVADALGASASGDGRQPDHRLPEAADSVLALALLARLPETTRLLRLACQVLRDVTRRNLQPDGALVELLQLAAGMPQELHADMHEDAPYAAMCAALYQRLLQAASGAANGRDIGTLRQQINARLDIRAECLDGLPKAALERLAGAIARGETLVEIEADMEAAPDNGAAFVAWLDSAGAQIGNQTVFHREVSEGARRESTRLRFLAAWPLTLEEVRRGLGRLDPAQRLFDLRACPLRSAVGVVAQDDGPAAPESSPGVSAVAPTVPTAMPAGDMKAARAQQTLRVDSEAVDQFVNRIGELVTLRNMMAHVLQSDVTARHRRARGLLDKRMARQLSDDELDELRALLADLDDRHESLMQTDLRIQGALGRMQEDVLALRVMPVGTVFNRLPRVVRDLGQAQRKQVNLDISGEDVRVDKSLVDVLMEPLMHLVRNAVDHGLETPEQRVAAGKPATATLALSARQQGGTLVVEIADDGRGLDIERIRRRARTGGLFSAEAIALMSERELAQLIFLPGFSTAEQVTEVSGRGVGMDVVKTRIAQIGGQVDVRTQAGQGTTFTLKLPLSVAIQSVILVAAGSRQLALPERSVSEILSLPVSALQSVQGQACCLLRGSMLPVYALGALLADAAAPLPGTRVEIIVVSDDTHRIGVLVDRVIGRPEVFVRDVHEDIARLPAVGGVSILGNGQVVIILDGEKLLDLAVHRAQALRSLLSVS